MKTFAQIREAKKPVASNTVFSKKILNVPVKINKDGNKFVVIIDGDTLDSYNSQAQAEKMATAFVKQLKV